MSPTVEDAFATDELTELSNTTCGDVLAPIPGERWVCIGPDGHGPGEHVAEDGTCW